MGTTTFKDLPEAQQMLLPGTDANANVTRLTSFSAFLLFCGAVFVTSFPAVLYLMAKPISGPKSSVGFYVSMPVFDHVWGIVGGAVWAVGTVSNSISGARIAPSISYALGQSAPMVATLWGLLYFGEYNGAPTKALVWVGAMFALYIGAIVVLIFSK
jgi:glucose uptake protein